jgi:hypothetical protein
MYVTIRWIFIVLQGCVPSARAKNSENPQECHDVMDVIEELIERRIDRLKRAI